MLGIKVAPANGSVRRLVIALDGDQELYRDRLDVNAASARQKFLDELVRRGAIAKDEWQLWDVQLTMLADEADRAAAEAAAKNAKPEAMPDWRDASREALGQTPQDVREAAEEMLQSPNLLKTVLADIEALGVAGEKELAATLYLLGTSRLLDRPLAGILQGPSSSGKSFVLDRVADLFPPEAVLRATALTTNALYYLPPG
ncbi:MAG: hypothetical protein GYA33_02735, partial [Thermogutta sp.]|nr:hypothetical protein [Thermogutta sp.]